jgi:hypothetical protein
LKTVIYTSDNLTSEAGLEEEEDHNTNKENNDFKHKNFKGKSAVLIFKDSEILKNM